MYRLSFIGVILIEYALTMFLHVHYGVYTVLRGYKITDGRIFMIWVATIGFTMMILCIMYSIKHKGE